MTQRISKFLFAALLVMEAFTAKIAWGRAPDQAEFYAAADIGKDIAHWIQNMNPKPKSIAIFNVFANEPFDQDYAALVEAEIIKHLSRQDFDHVSSCSECRTPQIVLEGELLVVRKGMPDAETLKRIGERHPVEAFINVDIYRSSFYVLANAVMFSNPEGQLLSSERFSAPAMSVSTADVQFLVTGGVGKLLAPTSTTYSLAGNLMLVEEMGFAKGGLSIGAVTGPAMLIYTLPTIAFRGGFGNINLTWQFNMGAGFGLAGGEKGITLRGGLEFFLGSFTVLGLDAIYFASDATTPSFSTYAGLHIGFVLGR